MSSEQVISAVRRSDEAWCAQLATSEPLAFGVAFVCPNHSELPGASQLRDAWLADVGPERAYAEAEAYFAQRGVRCDRWTPAAAQAVEPVERLLADRGWRRVERWALALTSPDAGPSAPRETFDVRTGDDIRILPARAMPKAFARSFEGEPAALAEAASDRLSDSNLDEFVAMIGGQAAGRAGYLEVGDIARLCDVRVVPAFRRRGVGRALVAHFVRLARRLSPRLAVASCVAGDAGALAFLNACGFVGDGRLVEFHRNME